MKLRRGEEKGESKMYFKWSLFSLFKSVKKLVSEEGIECNKIW